MFVDSAVEIAAISVVLAVVSQAIQMKYIDKEKMKKQQEAIKSKQARMKELMSKEDQKSKNELEAIEKEMMQIMQEMMHGSTRVMIFSMVVFLPALAIMSWLYEKVIIDLAIPLPWLKNGFDLFNIGTWGIDIYGQTTYFGWYFVTYLIATMVLNVVVDLAKKSGILSGVKNG